MDTIANYFLDHFLEKLRAHYKPEAVYLWGSRVYGSPKEYSDLDMIVVSDRFKGVRFVDRALLFVKELGLLRDAEINAVDPICYTPEEFEKKKKQVCIIQEALKKGVRVV